ncbi:MAG TPA: hypothetical protein VGP27_26080, partial [Mycobacterium sp.]|nr:hypothetical protein [Mycobacterium sp.]
FPNDASHSAVTIGHNNAAMKDQSGTCGDAVFTSAALGAASFGVDPTWSGEPSKANVSLYTRGVPDGSDSVFEPDSVHQAMIGVNDGGPDQTGC